MRRAGAARFGWRTEQMMACCVRLLARWAAKTPRSIGSAVAEARGGLRRLAGTLAGFVAVAPACAGRCVVVCVASAPDRSACVRSVVRPRAGAACAPPSALVLAALRTGTADRQSLVSGGGTQRYLFPPSSMVLLPLSASPRYRTGRRMGRCALSIAHPPAAADGIALYTGWSTRRRIPARLPEPSARVAVMSTHTPVMRRGALPCARRLRHRTPVAATSPCHVVQILRRSWRMCPAPWSAAFWTPRYCRATDIGLTSERR